MSSAIFPATLANIDAGEYRVSRRDTPIAVYDKTERGMFPVSFTPGETPGSFTLDRQPAGEVWAQIEA